MPALPRRRVCARAHGVRVRVCGGSAVTGATEVRAERSWLASLPICASLFIPPKGDHLSSTPSKVLSPDWTAAKRPTQWRPAPRIAPRVQHPARTPSAQPEARGGRQGRPTHVRAACMFWRKRRPLQLRRTDATATMLLSGLAWHDRASTNVASCTATAAAASQSVIILRGIAETGCLSEGRCRLSMSKSWDSGSTSLEEPLSFKPLRFVCPLFHDKFERKWWRLRCASLAAPCATKRKSRQQRRPRAEAGRI